MMMTSYFSAIKNLNFFNQKEPAFNKRRFTIFSA